MHTGLDFVLVARSVCTLAGLYGASRKREVMDEHRLVNLTGHRVTAINWDDQILQIPSSGYLRVESSSNPGEVIHVGGLRIPLIDIIEKRVDGPPTEPGTLYIVSGVVAAKAHRDDFVVPSRVERNKNGTVVGCRAFARLTTENIL